MDALPTFFLILPLEALSFQQTPKLKVFAVIQANFRLNAMDTHICIIHNNVKTG